MQSSIKWHGVAVLVLAGAPVAAALAGDTYYVSPTGNDAADGLTAATAWATLNKVNNTTFTPGSQVLFARGGNWHESLSASSSGTAQDPITYGAYGTGAKPTFWGSDPVANSSFSKVAGTGSTYVMTSTQVVNSFLADHNFYRSAYMNTGANDFGTNIGFVDETPNSWYYDEAISKLYVNTGGVNPTKTGTVFTAAHRDNVVYSNGKSNLVFKDLVVEESAKANAGYAFSVLNSENVRIEDSEAYNAGKHHFGVLNSTGFVGERLYATASMPDQGYGGATAFVTYSDGNEGRHGDTSQWLDSTAADLGPGYLGFYTHGLGVGDVLVKNLTVRGSAGISVATEAAEKQNIRLVGGHLDEGALTVYGNNVTVDGLRITGATSSVDVRGNDNTVQNVLMTGAKPETGYYTAMADQGIGNTFQFNTVALDPSSPVHATAIAILNALSNTRLIGNIFDTPDAVLREWFAGQAPLQADFNLYSPDARVLLNSTWATLAQWQAMGYDLSTLATDPKFADALAGDFTLADGSPALDALAAGQLNGLPGWDLLGNLRPEGGAYDLGAFESVVPEPASAAFIALMACAGVLGRRGRRAK